MMLKLVSATFFRQVFAGVLQITTLIIIARVLSVAEMGQYTIMILVPTLLSQVLTLGMQSANIYGIGRTSARDILAAAKIEPTTRVKDLTEAEEKRIRDIIDSDYTVEGDLQRLVTNNIKRLKDINCYRGLRHKAGLPTRGQRTRTNARTRKGRAIAVGGAQPKAATKT